MARSGERGGVFEVFAVFDGYDPSLSALFSAASFWRSACDYFLRASIDLPASRASRGLLEQLVGPGDEDLLHIPAIDAQHGGDLSKYVGARFPG
jgi:hypothetical protein